MEKTEAILKRCRVDGCRRPYRAKGYCNLHYKKWRQGELPHTRYKTCVHEGCRKPRKIGSLCEEHGGVKEAASTAGPAEKPVEAPPAPAQA